MMYSLDLPLGGALNMKFHRQIRKMLRVASYWAHCVFVGLVVFLP